jgi:hypothetical protein
VNDVRREDPTAEPVEGQFLGLATTSKWAELQALMAEMSGAAPYWRSQRTDGSRYPVTGWDTDWEYQFRLEVYKYLEWCELMPRAAGFNLTLEDIRQVCAAIGFEVEPLADRIRVLGYRRLAAAVGTVGSC